jgi:hypothetical protein
MRDNVVCLKGLICVRPVSYNYVFILCGLYGKLSVFFFSVFRLNKLKVPKIHTYSPKYIALVLILSSSILVVMNCVQNLKK